VYISGASLVSKKEKSSEAERTGKLPLHELEGTDLPTELLAGVGVFERQVKGCLHDSRLSQLGKFT